MTNNDFRPRFPGALANDMRYWARNSRRRRQHRLMVMLAAALTLVLVVLVVRLVVA